MSKLQLEPHEEKPFKKAYGTTDDRVLARRFGITKAVVESEADRLCLAKDKAWRKKQGLRSEMPRWTDVEVELLQREYADASNHALAQLFKRSVKSIVSKAHSLGLKKSGGRLREMGEENVRRRYR